MLSPQAAAAAAAAPAEFGISVVKSAQDVVGVFAKIQDAEDTANFNQTSVNAEIGTKQAIDSEDWKRTDIDGKPTEQVMRQRYEKTRSQAFDSLSAIKDTRNRNQASARLKQFYQGADLDFDAKATKNRVAALDAKSADSLKVAIDSESYELAREIASSRRQNGLIDDADLVKVNGVIDAQEQTSQATQLASVVDDAYRVGVDEGDVAYANLVAMDLDDGVAKEAMNLAGQFRTRWGQVYADKSARSELQAMERFNSQLELADSGGVLPGQERDMWKAGEFGTGAAAIRRRDQVRIRSLKGQQTQIYKMQVEESIRQGMPLLDSKEMRQGLDQYYRERTEGMSADEVNNTLSEIVGSTGIVPPIVQSQIAALGRTQATLPQAATLYQAVTRGGALPIMDKVSNQILDAATLIQSGVPAAQAAEFAWNNQFLTDEQKVLMEDNWESSAVNVMADDRDAMLDNLFDPGVFDTQPDAPAELKMQYEGVYRSIYFSTNGNAMAAAAGARQTIAPQWKRTRLNGDWEIQKDGIEGDVRGIRTRVKAQLALRPNLLGLTGEAPDLDTLRLEPTGEFDEEGKQRMRAYADGVPVMETTEDGSVQTLDYWLPMDKADDYAESLPRRKVLEKRLKEQKQDLTRARAGGRRFPGDPKPTQRDITGFESALKRTERDLAELPQVNF